MPYGIEIKNAADNIIISQDFTNYHQISTGTIANNGNWPTIGTNDILFIRANTNGATISSILGTATTAWATVSTGLIEYVIARRTPSPSSSTYGLRVYQNDGSSIAFDSGARAAKIVSSVTRVGRTDGLYLDYTLTLSQPFAVPAGRKRYITAQVFTYYTHIALIGSFPLWVPTLGFEQIVWTSDTSQTISSIPIGGQNRKDLISTKIFLTVDL